VGRNKVSGRLFEGTKRTTTVSINSYPLQHAAMVVDRLFIT